MVEPDGRSSGDPAGPATVVVCEGDETGQELLVEALRVLDSDLVRPILRYDTFDLSLNNRRFTRNKVVREAADAMRDCGLGLKAATVTPVGASDVGSPNRLLREGIAGSVIVRTGRRIPGVTPLAPVVHPIVIVRMAVGDAYGATEGRAGQAGALDEEAFRTETITRSNCRAVSEFAFRTAVRLDAVVYGGPKWTVSPVYEGMLKEEMDAAARRHQRVEYKPTLIDAAYAGLLTEAAMRPLVVPALNRDGDCLSDLVLGMYGSIAGAESMLLALDEHLDPVVAMAEAPHGTAPALQGRDLANPMAMLLAIAALLDQAGLRGTPGAIAAGMALRQATLACAAAGIRTPDLGGTARTSEVVTEVLAEFGKRSQRSST